MKECATIENCDSGERCVERACIANSAPVAKFTVTGETAVGGEVTLDASTSSDPDEGDSITSYSWEISTTDAGCDAPTVTDKTATATVYFACAGHYTVRLTATDEMNTVSEPATKTVAVTGSSVAALIEASQPLIVEHRCTESPLVCHPNQPVALSATIKSGSYTNVRWSVAPPAGRELGAGRRVTFTPSPNALQPTVAIETDGLAISGDWIFKVELLDGSGNRVDSATTRVSIANAPPVVDPVALDGFDHRYDRQSVSTPFLASGQFAVQVTDPDGDPVTPHVSYNHTGDGSATFLPKLVGQQPIRVGFDVSAQTAAELIGPNVHRTITVDVSDVNGGATTTGPVGIVIWNRGPGAILTTDSPSPHWYDVGYYRSAPEVGTWTDPDGDPLTFEVAADSACANAPAYDSSTGVLTLVCVSPGPLSDFVNVPRTATITARDPWTSLPPVAIAYTIGNTAPTLTPPSSKVQPQITCSYHTVQSKLTCPAGPTTIPGNLFAADTANLPVTVSDPDGDPLKVVASAAGKASPWVPCAGACTVPLPIGAEDTCSDTPSSRTANLTVSDGVLTEIGKATVQPVCW